MEHDKTTIQSHVEKSIRDVIQENKNMMAISKLAKGAIQTQKT